MLNQSRRGNIPLSSSGRFIVLSAAIIFSASQVISPASAAYREAGAPPPGARPAGSAPAMSLGTSQARSGSMEIFPAGTRLSVFSSGEGGAEIHLVIAASGPSLLWVQALSPGIKFLRIGNKEVSATAVASNGMAECAIPVYASGPVDVTILSAPTSATSSGASGGGSGKILVTSFYGMGDPVAVPAEMAAAQALRVESPMEGIQMVPIPPVASSPNVQVALPEKSAVSTAAQPPADLSRAAPNDVDHPTASDLPAPVQAPAEPAYIPLNQIQQSLFFGELTSGSLPARSVATFRVYVPNRLAFAVVVTGDYEFRVISEATAAESVSSGQSQWKRLVVAEPTNGYYVISIRGSGDYSIQVTSP